MRPNYPVVSTYPRSLMPGVTDKLARYTDAGQLTCVVCKLALRDDAAWPAHVAGAMHR